MIKSYTQKEVAEAKELLKEMQHNCLPAAGDTYNDVKRQAKHKALSVALLIMDKEQGSRA